MDAGTGVGDDGAGGQGGDDAALHGAVLAGDGGGHADKALAALGLIGAHGKVQLAAGAGDVLQTGGLGVHLAEQIHVDGVVDGDEVVDLADDVDVVGIVHRGAHHVGVVVHIVIQLLGAGGKGEHLAALVQLLVASGDLARHGHVHKAIHIHLGVDGQVLQVRLGDHRADGVGHPADAQLQTGPVGDLGHHQVGHGPVHVGGLAATAQLGHGGILALHHHVHVLDVDLAAVQAIDPGQVLVDLQDDDFSPVQHIGQVRGGQTIAEVAVLVHGGHLDHGHVHGQVVPIEPGQLGIAHGGEEAHALGDDLPVNAAAMPAVPGEVVPGVLGLGDLGHPHGHAAAHLHVVQLILPGGQGLVQGHGVVGTPAVVHPVAGLDDLYRLVGGGQLLLIQCLIVHVRILRI